MTKETKKEKRKRTHKDFLVLNGYAVFVTQPSVQRFRQIANKETSEKGTLEKSEQVRLVSKRLERRIKNLSQQWFIWQKKNCVVYGKTEGGVALRLLPFELKKEFLELMKFFEREYEAIQKELDDWIGGRKDDEDEFSFEDVRKTLEGRGLHERTTSFNIKNTFDYEIIELHMSPVYLREGQEEAKRIARKNAEWIIKSINSNLYEILEKITKAGTTNYKPKTQSMLKNLNEIKTKAEAWGVEEIYEEMFDIIDSSIHAVASEKELSKEQLEPIAKNLAKGLGIDYEDNPYSILEKMSEVKKGITPREASFLDSMIG